MKRILFVLFFSIGTHWVWPQSTITYTEGPAFQIPDEFAPAILDLDHDGSPDFSLISSTPICTADIPISGCSLSFCVMAPGTNAILVQTKLQLDALPWTNLDFVIPASTTNTMVDLPTALSTQFFRVVEAD